MVQGASGDCHGSSARALAAVREDLGDVSLLRGECELHAAGRIDGDGILGSPTTLLEDVCRYRAKDREIGRGVVLRRLLADRYRLVLEGVEDVTLLLGLAVGHERGDLDNHGVARLCGNCERGAAGVRDKGAVVGLVDDVPGHRRHGHVRARYDTEGEGTARRTRLLSRLDRDLVVVGIDVILEGDGDARRSGELGEALVASVGITNLLARVESELDGPSERAPVTGDTQSDDGGSHSLERVGVLEHLVELCLRAADLSRGEEAWLGSGLHEPLRVDLLVAYPGDGSLEQDLTGRSRPGRDDRHGASRGARE